MNGWRNQTAVHQRKIFCSGFGTTFTYIAVEAMADSGVPAALQQEIALKLILLGEQWVLFLH